MAENTWEIRKKQREAELKKAREVLSSINDDNYKDFANEPMFDYNQEKAPKGLNGKEAYEGFFRLRFDTAAEDASVVSLWKSELAIDQKLRKE